MSEQHVESEYERGYAAGFQSGRNSRAGEIVELRRRVRALRGSLTDVVASKSPWEVARQTLKADDAGVAEEPR